MLSRKLLLRGALLLLVAGVAAGLYQLFALRLQVGDVYPAYSTLRADPLGAKVLSEALAEMPGVTVERNFLPLPKLHPAEPPALIYAGLGRVSMWEPGELDAFEALVKGGARAVFAFRPEALESEAEAKKRAAGEAKEEKEKAASKKKHGPAAATPSATPAGKPSLRKPRGDAEFDGKSFREVATQWGFSFAVAQGKEGAAFSTPAEIEAQAGALEPALPWHSALWFDQLQPAWRVFYRAGGKPVVIERTLGSGTIVLASDAFFLSNEALHSEARAPKFLSWLIGAHRLVIFDEDHHGLREQPGIATLMRKYHLHGLIAALALLAGLFLWQQAVPFLPVPEAQSVTAETVTGRGSAEGLRTLLRRTIPASRLIETCLAEWRGSADERRRARVEKAWLELPDDARHPVAAWRALSEAARVRRDRDRSA